MNKTLFLTAIMLIFATSCLAQLDTLSISLLGPQSLPQQQQTYYTRKGNDRSMMKTEHKNVVAAYNPVTLTFKVLMFLYQNVISQQLSKDCPYYYTCSNYAKLAVHEYGLVKGILLAGDRLMRCNRISLLDVNDISVDEATHSIIDDPSMY